MATRNSRIPTVYEQIKVESFHIASVEEPSSNLIDETSPSGDLSERAVAFIKQT
jgi:hypothetical protein